MTTTVRTLGRLARHRRIRKRVVGLTHQPRLSVFRSHKHLNVQLINDFDQKTLLGYSTQAAEFRKHHGAKSGGIAAAEQLGRLIATKARELGITRVVFDRGGYHYHGRVKALAEAARQTGLQF